ncbi:MAG: signal peptide peptidase SppA [Phycisphaeraceae bacterium]
MRAVVAAMLAPLVLSTAAEADAGAAFKMKPADFRGGGSGAGPLVGWLELSGPLRDGPVPFAWIDDADAEPSLERVLGQIEHVASSDTYTGLVIHLDQADLTLAQIQAIAAGIAEAREAGRLVMTFAQRYGMRDYLLASAADKIMLQHRGLVELSGMAVEELYLGGLLEKLGVQADLVQVGDYKGAADPLTRTGPSDAWDENIDALVDDLYAHMIETIADNRGLAVDELRPLVAEAWTMTDEQYVEAGLVDRLTDRDMLTATERAYGPHFAWDETMGVARGGRRIDSPLALFGRLFDNPQPRTRRPSIAVIRVVGPVTSGDSSIGDGLLSSDSAGSRTLLRALEQARHDEQIRGVILQIDSPGGSALASEVIWQGIRQLGEHKPVYASLGDLAASGGYYVAVAADEIYVHPGTIVGSIGVVGGKLVLGELYETLGVHVTRRSRGPMADMFNSVEPFTAEQREAVRAAMQRVYDQFVDRVERGRGDRLGEIANVAEGRVFTGRQAVELGMADTVGSLRDARQAMARALELEPGGYDVIHLPPPMNLGDFLGSLLGVHGPAAPGAAAPQGSPRLAPYVAATLQGARQVLGPRRFGAMRQLVTGLTLLNAEPALTLMPYAVLVE